MRTLIVRWAIVVVAVFLVAWGLPQTGLVTQPLIQYSDWATLALFAGVLALLNTFVAPVLKLLSLPITCLTAGLFVVVINVAMFALAATLVPGMQIAGVGAALIGALAVSVVGWVANLVMDTR